MAQISAALQCHFFELTAVIKGHHAQLGPLAAARRNAV